MSKTILDTDNMNSLLPPSSGSGDMEKSIYDTNNSGVVDNSEKVNNLTVETAVPSGAVFTDTIYDDTAIQNSVANKVDKISGKGLSTEDYTSAEKTKLAGLSNVDGNGRLVKFLTSSVTLTMSSSVDDKAPAYLTSNYLKPGWYLIYARGAGASGAAGYYDYGGGGGGQGALSRGLFYINSNISIHIGAGGNGATGSGNGTAGGETYVADGGDYLLRAGGGAPGQLYQAGEGGTGAVGGYKPGGAGGNGGGDTDKNYKTGGKGGGEGGSRGYNNNNVLPALGCGSGGGIYTNTAVGGNGYVEIYEWS